jgi:uncharacterized protein YkwD
MHSARSAAFVLVTGALAGAALLATATATPAQAGPTLVQQVITLTNQQRAAHGCGALAPDPALGRAAQNHSTDMAAHDYVGHTGSDGSDPGARIGAAGYRAGAWAENVAAGQPTAAAVVRAWMTSPEHSANILNCALTNVGVGYGVNDGTPYHTFWTEDLGRH